MLLMMAFFAPLTAHVLNSHIAENQKMKPMAAFPPPFTPAPYKKKNSLIFLAWIFKTHFSTQ